MWAFSMNLKFSFSKAYKLLTLSDKILIIFILLLTILLSVNFSHRPKNAIAKIYYKNELVGRFYLKKNQIINIDKGIKAEIKDGKIKMIESTCKNKFCIKEGWSNTIPIICVPNKVIIKIENSRMLITR